MTSEEKKYIYGKLNKLDNSVKRILQILENDDSTDTKGLVKSVRDVEAKVFLLYREKDVQKGRNAVYGAIGAFLTLVGYWIIQAFINNKIN